MINCSVKLYAHNFICINLCRSNNEKLWKYFFKRFFQKKIYYLPKKIFWMWSLQHDVCSQSSPIWVLIKHKQYHRKDMIKVCLWNRSNQVHTIINHVQCNSLLNGQRLFAYWKKKSKQLFDFIIMFTTINLSKLDLTLVYLEKNWTLISVDAHNTNLTQHF